MRLAPRKRGARGYRVKTIDTVSTPDPGLGIYPGSIANDVQDIAGLNLGALLVTVSGPQTQAVNVAIEQRRRRPTSFIAIRTIPTWCAEDDGLQYRDDESVGDVVSRWVPEIAAAWRLAPPGTFDLALGINERTPAAQDVAGWTKRLDIEWGIGYALAGIGIEYGWGSLNVGALDTPMMGKAARLFARFVTCYHSYLRPGAKTLAYDDDYHARRPFKFWLPELQRLFPGTPARRLMRGLFVGEAGTYEPWDSLGLDATRAAKLCAEIGATMARDANSVSVPYHGCAAYGYRLVGHQTRWNLDGALSELRGVRAPVDKIAPLVVPPGMPLVMPPPQPPTPQGGPVLDIALTGPYVVKICPNYKVGRAQTRGIMIHATRGPGDRTLPAEYAATVGYFQVPGTPASAHLVVGPTEVTRCVHDADAAWHAFENNETHLGIEVAQPSSEPDFTPAQYAAVAEACRLWAAKYKIPLVRVMSQTWMGIIGHQDSEQGRRSGKSDPGAKWNWEKFLALLQVPAPATLNRTEVGAYSEWAQASLAADGKDVRGDVGLMRFKQHLAATGRDPTATYRFGWPIKG